MISGTKQNKRESVMKFVRCLPCIFFIHGGDSFRPWSSNARSLLLPRIPQEGQFRTASSNRLSTLDRRPHRAALDLKLLPTDRHGEGDNDDGDASNPKSVSSIYMTSLSGTVDDDDDASSSSSSNSSWSLKNDWALIDSVPKFTISTPLETRTFWSQLWSSTPVLFSSATNPNALFRRMIELKEEEEREEKARKQQQQQQQRSQDGTQWDGRPSAKRLPAFGPSPPVLHNWQIDFQRSGPNGRNTHRVVGQISDGERNDGISGCEGRTIWFEYHVVGRLRGDPFSDLSSSMFSLIPGGYVEAVGGRIYELGQPMLLDEWNKEQSDRGYMNHDPLDKVTVVKATNSRDKNDESETKSMGWWIPAGTATVSALVASTILSACIGYGAGLSMVDDPQYAHGSTSSTAFYAQYSSQKLLPPESSSSSSSSSASSPVITITTKQWQQSMTTDPSQPPSVEELRARAEYRILREQRLLDALNQKLERDQLILKQLEGMPQPPMLMNGLLP